MGKTWKSINVAEIEKISGVGGKFGQEEMDASFQVKTTTGQVHHFHYNSRKVYEARNELMDLYNAEHNIPETYLLENRMNIKVDDVSIPFGFRVENNKGNYEYKTFLEIEKLTTQGKIRDEGWRHCVYIAVLDIKEGKIVRGDLTEAYEKQLKELSIPIRTVR